jgi:hypothetical protein
MSILKWKIRFKGILERKPDALLIYNRCLCRAPTKRIMSNALPILSLLACEGLWRRVALNERRYIGSAKLREIQSIAPIL